MTQTGVHLSPFFYSFILSLRNFKLQTLNLSPQLYFIVLSQLLFISLAFIFYSLTDNWTAVRAYTSTYSFIAFISYSFFLNWEFICFQGFPTFQLTLETLSKNLSFHCSLKLSPTVFSANTSGDTSPDTFSLRTWTDLCFFQDSISTDISVLELELNLQFLMWNFKSFQHFHFNVSVLYFDCHLNDNFNCFSISAISNISFAKCQQQTYIFFRNSAFSCFIYYLCVVNIYRIINAVLDVVFI